MADRDEVERDYTPGDRVFPFPTNVRKKFSQATARLTRGAWAGEAGISRAIRARQTSIALPVGTESQFAVGSKIGIGETERATITGLSGLTASLARLAPVDHRAGARIQLLDLVVVQIERSLDGFVTWDVLLSSDTPGGTVLDRNGVPRTEVTNRYKLHNSATGKPVDIDGDVRVRIVNKVQFRTAMNLEILEASER